LSAKRVLVIGNPAAHGGRAKTLYDEFLSYLKTQTAIDFTGYLTKQAKDNDGIRRAVLEFNPTVISIIGGDGTINDVINVKEVISRKLHLIPAGSGNDFSRLVNGEMSKNEAFDLINSTNLNEVDTGLCNGQRFLNGVGLGFDGSIARQTVHMKLPFSTSWKYWIAIFKNIFLYRSTVMNVHTNDSEFSQKTFMISVANGTEYGGGFRVSPLSDASGGKLDLVVIGSIPPLKRLFYVPIVEKGKHLHLKIVKHQTTKKVEIDSKQVIYAHLDGELMSAHHYSIHIAEKLNILCVKKIL